MYVKKTLWQKELIGRGLFRMRFCYRKGNLRLRQLIKAGVSHWYLVKNYNNEELD
jgi:hypothetical protein